MSHILLHTLLFPPDGNSNAYIFADIALELQKYGHTLTVITTTPHYSILQANLDEQPFSDGAKKWYKNSNYHGIACYHIVVPPRKGGIIQRLISFLRFHCYTIILSRRIKTKIDIVISQSPPLSIGLVSALIAKAKKAKSIFVVQDLFPDGPIMQGKIKNKLIIGILRKIEKRVYFNNDAIIAISNGIYNHLSKRVPLNKILRTIPNFVDTDIYHPMPKENHLAYKYGVNGKFIISYVGNIGNAHDLSPIFFCAKELKDLDIMFIIAGNGIKMNYYKNLKKEEYLDNVKFIGFQKREDTPMINAFSDVCLVLLAPHIRGYSFPSKIYTLMSMEKPIIVVCSVECDAAEFITESSSGWAIECGHNEEFVSLIKSLYYNRKLLMQTGKNSKKIIDDGYTKEYVGSQYNELLKEMCS